MLPGSLDRDLERVSSSLSQASQSNEWIEVELKTDRQVEIMGVSNDTAVFDAIRNHFSLTGTCQHVMSNINSTRRTHRTVVP